MTSLRAHAYAWLVKRNVRARLGRMLDVERVRRTLETPAFPDPGGVAYEPGSVGGIAGEWIHREGAAGRPRLLYLHGGGFIACSARTHRPVTGYFAQRGFAVFAPNYRLAPEHPFPAAIEDAVAVWRAFAAEGPAVLAGDSAGGNLALALMLSAREAGLPLPRAAALFSPATDFLGAGASHTANAARDAMFDPEGLAQLLPNYLAGADPAQPLASPLYADLRGLPPLLLHVGERELLRDDATRLAERARAAGVPADLTVFPVVPHVWQFAHGFLPEARRSLDGAVAFLKAHAAPATPQPVPTRT
ncbi:alpha/beta hydrolase [Methylobacterium planeticum]|uniref:Alpha/beta hydrolase n=1 Tax=Methylobacterium planeticum TaxID=2615211 RepID=A0A6N6MR12_9HYPH|nr:alpha/beta hydrolase [Methylobacterium planeticum]KAB1070958.1 alpha/beta hydrolase [Methylobacterium planeticum]